MSQDALLDTPPAPPKKPQPITLRSLHDYSLVTTSLEHRKEDLKGLAKKVGLDGYSKESRAIQADAEAIEFHVLPQFREQRELPLVTFEQLEKEIAGALARPANVAFDQLAEPKVQVTPEVISRRKRTLIESLSKRIALYVQEVAENAYNQGLAAREQSAEALAVRAVGTLRAQGD
jgi:hypothetical protein